MGKHIGHGFEEDDFPLTEENEELLDVFGSSEMESISYDPIPGISDEENMLIEEWWEDYEKMDEADLIRGHM
ncbi:MAG: hypothetical protein WD426_08950 [Anditalea sp.]